MEFSEKGVAHFSEMDEGVRMGMRRGNPQLDSLVQRLSKEIPSLEVTVAGGGLRLGRGAWSGILEAEDIDRFTSNVRASKRREGTNYLDLKTGELYVNEPELLLLFRISQSDRRLTPQQCAVLAVLLERDEFGFLSASEFDPGAFRAELAKRSGLKLTPSSVTKLRSTLRSARLVRRGRPDASKVFEAILSDFRLDAVGQVRRLPAPPQGALEWIRDRASGARLVEGVAGVLSQESGGVIEPVDVLVERSVALRLEEELGGPVDPGFRGPSILVRGVSRLGLDELAPEGAVRLSTILAIADGLASDAPVQVEAARALAEGWRKRWK